ncbi:MAG TPA: PEP/pyruvate-binding domain-containing protein [Solirubrobacteraceae bacterium]|nr:PEP/pyruvate-binding domain-containing protein [Solirubrobacteraceae bacterium]
MAKGRIITALGESELLLPDLLRRAQSANDRVKYLLTLLQTARAAADGDRQASDLHAERVASGTPDARLDRVVHASRLQGEGSYTIPAAGEVVGDAFAEVETMLAPLQAAGTEAAGTLTGRVESLRSAVSAGPSTISGDEIALLTAGRRAGPDSLHLVVMDAHRELNRLTAEIAGESIAGAMAYGIASDDRAFVSAFARGVQRTERLRFNHPGLATVAMRSGDALVLQNDIGESDMHVVVVRIVDHTVTLTYTDLHLSRLLFLQRMLAETDISWEDTRSRSDDREGGFYHLAVGRFSADADASLEAFLELLGSRMVFLIDWNRARKRLRGLVGNRAAIKLLDWAASREHGHMAFLLAGGEQLVYDAWAFATERGTRAGVSLSDLMGEPAASSYLRAVLRICSEGLLCGRSQSLISDEVRAELIGYVRTARQELLELIGKHAELVVSIGEAARDALEQAALPDPGRDRGEVARLAREWERRADAVVNEVRGASGRTEEPAPFLDLVREADDVADALEEAAYSWSLVPEGRLSGDVLDRSRRMMTLVLDAARAHMRAVHLGRAVQRGGPSEDMDSFLEANHHVVALEREADEARREVQAALVSEVQSAGALFVVAQAIEACEEAADALMRAAQLMRRQVLGDVVHSEPPPEARREARSGALTAAPQESAPPDELYVLDEGGPVPDSSSIGGKGYGLARMARAGLPVPEAAILSTEVCRRAVAGDLDAEHLRMLVSAALRALQTQAGLQLGSARAPLILSVRSGAPASMPGMLETVLNVGLCDETVEGLLTLTGNPRLAWDSYRRLIESFAHVVLRCPLDPFEQATESRLLRAGVKSPRDLDSASLAELTREHLDRVHTLTGESFPQDPLEQLERSVRGVLDSWQAPKAADYRRLHNLAETLGTAVVLQRMVFGNAGGLSGSGVGFTRDPATGEHTPYIEFMLDAQGEDIVSGRRLPRSADRLAVVAPEIERRLADVCSTLESEFGDAQEFEFTVQDGELYLLQCRTAARTPWAALRIAVDQVDEGLVSSEEARRRLAGLDLQAIRRKRLCEDSPAQPICEAQPVSTGVACGPIALDVAAAQRIASEGRAPVLVRHDTSTEDLAGVVVAAGLLTASGGRTSHAAVIARELDKPCVVGAGGLDIDLERRRVRIGGREFAEGDEISIDGGSGRVFAGSVAVEEEAPTSQLAIVSGW